MGIIIYVGEEISPNSLFASIFSKKVIKYEPKHIQFPWEGKHISEKLDHLSLQVSNIIDDISSTPLEDIPDPKVIDVKTLKLKRKLAKLEADIRRLSAECNNSSNDIAYNHEQRLYKYWKKIFNKHPIVARILGFLICTITTALLTVLVENLLSNQSSCSCNCSGNNQTVYQIEDNSNTTINIYQFCY